MPIVGAWNTGLLIRGSWVRIPEAAAMTGPHKNVIASMRGAQPHSGAVAFITEDDANAILSLFPANFQRSLRVAT